MVLAFSVADIINVPFGYIMDVFYRLTQNYGFAVMLFAICVSLVMYPLNAKNRINSIKQARLNPVVKKIREMFPNDTKVQNRLMEDLYQKENVSLSGGCLLSIVPILILLALYGVVTQPIVYMLHESKETAQALIEHIQTKNPELIGENAAYAQVIASSFLGDFAESIKTAFPAIKDATLNGINYNFLSLDLTQIPQLDFTQWESVDWAHIGLFALPLAAVAVHIVPIVVQKIKNAIRMNKAKKNGEATVMDPAKSGKKINFITPLMWFLFAFACFHVPAVLALYWLTKSCMDNVMEIFIRRKIAKMPPMKTDVESLLKAANIEAPAEDTLAPAFQADGYACKESNIKRHEEMELHSHEYAQVSGDTDTVSCAYSNATGNEVSTTTAEPEHITRTAEADTE